MSARRALGALLSAALLLASACTDDDPVAAPAKPPTKSPSPTVAPTRGGSVRVGMIGSPATLDPYSPVASDLTYALVRPIYPSLYELSPRGKPEPSLARSLKGVAGGVRIELRRARWSDGTAITSGDVVASIARARPPSGFARVSRARAVSRRVVVLRARGTVRDWPRALATLAFVLPRGSPKGRVGGLVGGPSWRSVSYRSGFKVAYGRNRHAPGPERPYLNKVTVLFFESVPVMLDWLRDGRLDAAVPPATVNLADRLESMNVEYDAALGWESVWMDLTQTLTRAERSSIVATIDRNRLEDGLVRGAGRVSDTLHPGPRGAEGSWGGGMGTRSKIERAVRFAIPAGDELLFLLERAIQIQLAERDLDVDLIVGQAADFYGPWRDASPADVSLIRSAGAPGVRDRPREARELTALPLAHVRTYLAWKAGMNGLRVNPTFDGPLWNMQEWWRSGRK